MIQDTDTLQAAIVDRQRVGAVAVEQADDTEFAGPFTIAAGRAHVAAVAVVEAELLRPAVGNDNAAVMKSQGVPDAEQLVFGGTFHDTDRDRRLRLQSPGGSVHGENLLLTSVIHNGSTESTVCTEEYEAIKSRIHEIGFICTGSLHTRRMVCGKPNCRCSRHPGQRHGPYYQLTWKEEGKTIARRLSAEQAKLYQEWIANRQRLASILSQLHRVSVKAARHLLRAVIDTSFRVTRPNSFVT